MANKAKDDELSPKEELFCLKYVELGTARQAYTAAGYKAKNENSVSVMASRLLNKVKINKRIQELLAERTKSLIADGQEVMEYFTRVMRGEEKDQFDLDVSISERTKAALELAKRTVDIDNRLAGKADAKVEIKLNWERKEE